MTAPGPMKTGLMWLYSVNTDKKSILLDEAHYVTYPYFTDYPNTQSFAIGILFRANSTATNKGTLKRLIGTKAATLNAVSGWQLYYDHTNHRLQIDINDGNATPYIAYSTTNQYPEDNYNISWINIDRTYGVSFADFTTGQLTAAASDNTLSCAGSLNSTNNTIIGGGSTANECFKGYISVIYFCPNLTADYTVPDQAWVQEWLFKTRFYHPRVPPLFYSTAWNWANTLNGKILAGNGPYTTLTGTYSAGSPTYSANYPQTIENYKDDYTIAQGDLHELTDNPLSGYIEGYLPFDTIQRSLDGTIKYFIGPTKKRISIQFTSDSWTQKLFIEGLWHSKSLIAVSKDAKAGVTFLGYMIAPPEFSQISPTIWRYSFELEEA